MKVAILAGGLGSRLSEETEIKPKPMVEIGGQPILWHIMKYYAHFGFNDFVIALGYKGEYIKRWMVDYALAGRRPHRARPRRRRSSTTTPSPTTGASTSSTPGCPRRPAGGSSGCSRYLGDEARSCSPGATACRRRPPRAARLPPVPRQARHADRRAAAGPLRPPRARGRPRSSSSPRSRRPARAGSTAPSSCSSRRCSTTSTATTPSSRTEPLEHLAKDGQLDGLPPPRLLAVHGHAPRQEAARGAVGRRRARRGRCGADVHVLVTGHDGYIGCVARAHAASSAATGRRARHATCSTAARSGAERDPVPALACDIRDVSPSDLEGFDARHPPGRHLQRPARRPRPATPTRSTTSATVRVAEAAKAAGRRALRLLVLVQPLRRARRRPDRRDRRVQPGHAVRRVEGAGRARPRRRWPTTTSARRSCATPPPTASRRACAATWSSTTSSATRSPPARCS